MWLQAVVHGSCLLLFIITSANCDEIYRRIANRVPIFSEHDATSLIYENDVKGCLIECSTFTGFVAAPTNLSDGRQIACVCLAEKQPLANGVIKMKGSEIYEIPQRTGALDYFLYIDVEPMGRPIQSFAGFSMSLDQCALTCLNMIIMVHRQCHAFQYDVINQLCQLFGQSHLRDGGPMTLQDHPTKTRTMYFEYLSSELQSFSGEWSTRSVDKVLQTMNFSAYQCAGECNRRVYCNGFNYYPTEQRCELLQTSVQPNVTDANEKVIYFRMLPTKDCQRNTTVTVTTESLIKSPGWPRNISTEKCTWNYITPLGRGLSVTLLNSSLPTSDGKCLVGLQMNDDKVICENGQVSANQPSTGKNELTLAVVKKRSYGVQPSGRYLAQISNTWSCRSITNGSVIMGYTGQIASPNYPEAVDEDSNCEWFIQAPEQSKRFKLFIHDFHLQDEKTKNPATLTIVSSNRSLTVNGTRDVKKDLIFYGNITITFQSKKFASSPPKGFYLSYALEGEIPNVHKKTKNVTLNSKTQPSFRGNIILPTSLQVLVFSFSNSDPEGRLRINISQLHMGKDLNGSCTTGSVRIIAGWKAELSLCEKTMNDIIIYSKAAVASVIIDTVANHLYNSSVLQQKSVDFEVTAVEPITPNTTVIDSSTLFASPNISNHYPANDRQQWIIQGNGSEIPILRFQSIKLALFEFLGLSVCDNDRLYVKFGATNLTFCGHVEDSNLPGPLVSPDKKFTVLMMTDDRYEDSGFQASVDMSPEIQCDLNKTVFVSTPGALFTTPQLGNGTCHWTLRQSFAIVFLTDCHNVWIQYTPMSKYQRFDCKTRNITLKVNATIRWSPTLNDTWFSAKLDETEQPFTTTSAPPNSTTTSFTTSGPLPSTTTKPDLEFTVKGLIIGLVVTTTLLLIVVGFVVFFFIRQRYYNANNPHRILEEEGSNTNMTINADQATEETQNPVPI